MQGTYYLSLAVLYESIFDLCVRWCSKIIWYFMQFNDWIYFHGCLLLERGTFRNMDHGYCICYLNWFHIYGSRWIVTIKDNIFEHRFKKITDTFRCLRITNFKLHFFIVSDDIQEDLSDHYEIKYDCAEGVFQLSKYNLFKNKCERNQFIIVRTKITHDSLFYIHLRNDNKFVYL